MKSRSLLLASAFATFAPTLLAQAPTDCLCDYRFGDSCDSYDLSSRSTFWPGRQGQLVVGPIAPQCSLHVQEYATVNLAPSTGDFASVSFAVPNMASTLGLVFRTQAAGLDFVSAAGIVTSNVGKFTVGL